MTTVSGAPKCRKSVVRYVTSSLLVAGSMKVASTYLEYASTANKQTISFLWFRIVEMNPHPRTPRVGLRSQRDFDRPLDMLRAVCAGLYLQLNVSRHPGPVEM